MINKIKQKLRSQAGASISFALLLFLVCAVLCSVIITAATASSGRMAGIAESDQRYYAVTSAAELLKELMERQKVSIVEVRESTTTTTYDEYGEVVDPEPEPDLDPESEQKDEVDPENTYIVPNKQAGEIDENDLVATNKIQGITNNSIQIDAAKNYELAEPDLNGVLAEREFSLTSGFCEGESGLGLPYDALAVTVEETIGEDGSIIFTIYNSKNGKGEDSRSGDRYTQVLVFGADKSETTSTKTEEGEQTPLEAGYSVETKTTENKIITLSWSLTGIDTISQGAESDG